MKPDKYQQAVIDAYRDTSKNIFISATAGAGKTSTLVELSKRTPPTKNSIFLAFNKSIAEELGRKLPPTIKAQTLHGCALSALKQAHSLKFTIKENKYYTFAQEILEREKVHRKRIPSLSMQMCRLFDLMRFNLVFDGVKEVVELAERYGEECTETMAQRAITLAKTAEMSAKAFFSAGAVGTVPMDFTDMLLWAVNWVPNNAWKRYSVVMVDECQDISPLQYKLIQKIKSPTGRLIAVGDEKQSIYSFQGSNLDSLKSIKEAPNTITLPLSMTYRCSRAVVDEANGVFPNGIEAAPFAEDGAVYDGSVYDAREGDFILCRNNAPLVSTWLKLVKAGRRCVIMGKEFGDELIQLIDGVDDPLYLENELIAMQERLRAKGYEHPERCEPYAKLDEKIGIILDLYGYFGDMQTVRNRIYDIFVENQENRGVILSTIHKSKGLEAERVFFLQPSLIPSKFATTELAMYAEKCLRFVAITRAKRELIYVE